MSFHHKTVYVTLINTLVLMGGYFWWVSGRYAAGAFDGPDAGSAVGRSILILMGTGIVVQIIGMILFHFLQALVTQNPNPDQLIDERDRLIELRALRVSYHVTGLVFVLAIIALAMGWSIFAVFHIIVAGCAFGAVIEAAVQIIAYHRGG